MNIIIPLCGIGKRFSDAGYLLPKPLIHVFYKPMINHVIDNIVCSEEDKIFIIYHSELDNYNFSEIIHKNHPGITLISLSKRTDGAAQTVLLGLEYIMQFNNYSKECLIIDCDTIYNVNITKKLRNLDTNAVIYFKDLENNPIYSYVLLEEKKITDIREKDKVSNNANTGAYYFKNILELKNACKNVIENNVRFKNEFYISCVIKYMIENGQIFSGLEIDRKNFISLGTPQDLIKFQNNQLAFLFDLDGTLVKTDKIYYKVWGEILSKFNIVLTPQLFRDCIQGNTDDNALNQLNIDKNKYDLSNISKLKDELFAKNISEIEIIEGAPEFIKNKRNMGYFISIVTNCNRITCDLILNYIGIKKFINKIVIGNECANAKPHSEPYLTAIHHLNIAANNTIIFEDSKPGIISAMGVFPRILIGVDNGTNVDILDELCVENRINNYKNIDLEGMLENKTKIDLQKRIYESIKYTYDINNIDNIIIDTNKLKGGYISDVINVTLKIQGLCDINCVLKYENDYTSSLTKMAYKLNLFEREYYFYENISPYVNVCIPKYIGTLKNSEFISKGLLLENINRNDFILNLDLNKESVNVSLKVIEECSKMHARFWGKNLTEAFKELKKHNDPLFSPIWGNFIREIWGKFCLKWSHLIGKDTLLRLEKCVNNFEHTQDSLSSGDLTLCHGDVKSANIFYRECNGGYIPYFLDWQYISHGKGVQDIVFFMIESFNIDKINLFAEMFKKYYYIKIKEHGIKYAEEDYERDFELSICHFPLFVAIWFGTTPDEELIDRSFPHRFITKFVAFFEKYSHIY